MNSVGITQTERDSITRPRDIEDGMRRSDGGKRNKKSADGEGQRKNPTWEKTQFHFSRFSSKVKGVRPLRNSISILNL